MRYSIAFLLVISSTVNAQQTDWQCEQSPVFINNVHLVGAGDQLQTIYIKDGRVERISPAGEQSFGPDERLIDGEGATVLPGFIDSHTHFDTLAAGKDAVSGLDRQLDIFPVTMRQTLSSGVTTARTHLAALSDLRVMASLGADPCFPSPRLSLSGPGLLGGAPGLSSRLMRGVDNPDDARAKVAEMADLGVQWLALHRIGEFSPKEMKAIIDAARARGLRLMADTDEFSALEKALEAGVDTGEYLNRSLAPEIPAEILKRLAERQEPFFSVAPVGYYRSAFLRQSLGKMSLSKALFKFTDPRLARSMRASFEKEFKDDPYIKKIVESYPVMARKFAALGEAGAIQVIGTDAGSTGHFHGDAIWREFAAWKAFGRAPREIFAAATLLPARMLGRRDIGELSTGSHADLLLYKGDFLAGEFDQEKIFLVMKGGVVYVQDSQWQGPDTPATKSHIQKVKNAVAKSDT